jgi:hypothetical protein
MLILYSLNQGIYMIFVNLNQGIYMIFFNQVTQEDGASWAGAGVQGFGLGLQAHEEF